MRCARWFAGLAVLGLALPAGAADNKKLLLVTHSGDFIHDSVGVAEDVLKEIGPKNGFDVTCYRFTGDPEAKPTTLSNYSEKFRARTGKPVGKENCGRVNAETLKKFDCVLFFTTGDPLTKEEVKDLTEWVKAGGAYAGTHCASDTLYGATPYGELVGAYFSTHPPGLQKVRIKVEDPKHPAGKPFKAGQEYQDEIYIFRDSPYSREKLHIILSVDKDSFTPKTGARKDQDYAVSWCQQVGKGRSFYTSLGHSKEVWKDPLFQEHLMSGIKWANGQLEGDATPSSKLSAK